MNPIIETKPAPGYVHDLRPDRYPTRADWPRPGTYGHYKGKPVKLLDIWHAYRAVFKTGPYSTMAANLQDFVVWPFQNEPMPWTPAEIRASMPEGLL